jgi:hypothetical protein
LGLHSKRASGAVALWRALANMRLSLPEGLCGCAQCSMHVLGLLAWGRRSSAAPVSDR